MNKVKKRISDSKNKNFVCTNTDGTQYEFNQYRDLNQLGNEIYSDKISLDDAKNEQYNMSILHHKLNGYTARNPKKTNLNKKFLIMQKDFIILGMILLMHLKKDIF